MRAFRPSAFAPQEEVLLDAEAELERQSNIRLYEQRAQAGMPLFERHPDRQVLSLGTPEFVLDMPF